MTMAEKENKNKIMKNRNNMTLAEKENKKKIMKKLTEMICSGQHL